MSERSLAEALRRQSHRVRPCALELQRQMPVGVALDRNTACLSNPLGFLLKTVSAGKVQGSKQASSPIAGRSLKLKREKQ